MAQAKSVVSLGGEGGAVHAYERTTSDATYALSYTAEERRAFANHINDVLKDDAALKGALPMNPETDDLFKVRGLIALRQCAHHSRRSSAAVSSSGAHEGNG